MLLGTKELFHLYKQGYSLGYLILIALIEKNIYNQHSTVYFLFIHEMIFFRIYNHR